MSVETLIDKAIAVTHGNASELARLLQVKQEYIPDWRAGRRPFSPADRARVAAIGGDDAVQELVRATIEKHEGTFRGEQLKKVLGKLSRETGAVIVSGLPAVASLTFGVSWLIRCIVLLSPRQHPPAAA